MDRTVSQEELTRIRKEIGKRLAKARVDRGFTQQEMADKFGLALISYQHFEYGREIKGTMLIKLCEILQCSPDWLLGLKDEGQFLDPDDPIMRRLELACDMLNEEGREKVTVYAEDMTHNPNMTKSGEAEVPDIEVLGSAASAEVA